jgi:glycosyltransferase involved in cell wall biosynthesis
MKISIVMATYNREGLLYSTLYSLYKNCNKENFEVLISVDDDIEYLYKT